MFSPAAPVLHPAVACPQMWRQLHLIPRRASNLQIQLHSIGYSPCVELLLAFSSSQDGLLPAESNSTPMHSLPEAQPTSPYRTNHPPPPIFIPLRPTCQLETADQTVTKGSITTSFVLHHRLEYSNRSLRNLPLILRTYATLPPVIH